MQLLKITNSNNLIPNRTKKILKENINKIHPIEGNKLTLSTHNNNLNININKNLNNTSTSTFKDDDLNESKIKIKNALIKEGIYYLKQSEKLSLYLKKYYNKYHDHPKTKLSFYKFGRLIRRGAFGKLNLVLHVLTGEQQQ